MQTFRKLGKEQQKVKFGQPVAKKKRERNPGSDLEKKINIRWKPSRLFGEMCDLDPFPLLCYTIFGKTCTAHECFGVDEFFRRTMRYRGSTDTELVQSWCI